MNYDELDPGIREVVKWINDRGYTTTDSGDGCSKPEDERMVEGAHVVIRLPKVVQSIAAEADFVVELARNQGWPGAVIEGSYSTADRVSLLVVWPYGVGKTKP